MYKKVKPSSTKDVKAWRKLQDRKGNSIWPETDKFLQPHVIL